MSDQDRPRNNNRRSRRRGNRIKHDPQRPDISARVEAEAKQRERQGRENPRPRREPGPQANRQQPQPRNQDLRRPASIADRPVSDLLGGKYASHISSRDRKKGFIGSRLNWTPPETPEPVLPDLVCARCGKPIEGHSQAMGDATSSSFWHFDCALEHLNEEQNPREGEKLVYIGAGRFALVFFPDPRDQKQFQIRRIIPWEDKDKRPEWRVDIAGKYSRT